MVPLPRRIGIRQRLSPLKLVDRKVARTLLLIALGLVLLYSLSEIGRAPSNIDSNYLRLPVFLAGVIVLLQVAYKATGPKPINWMSIDIITMIPFCIVHLGLSLYWIMDWFPHEMDYLIFKSARSGNTSDQMCKGAILSVAALSAFAIGFNLIPDRHPGMTEVPRYDRKMLKRWRALGIFSLLVASTASLLVLLFVGREAFEGAYSGTTPQDQRLAYLLVISINFGVVGAALVSIASFRLHRSILGLGFFPTFILVGFAFGFAVQGDRGIPFAFAAIVLLAYTEHVRRLRLTYLVGAILAGSFIYALAGQARLSPQRNPISYVKTMMDVPKAEAWGRGYLELVCQSRVMYVALDHFPEKRDFFGGRLKVPQLIGIIPFGNRLLFTHRWLEPGSKYEKHSGHYLTYLMVHQTSGYGAGSTIVADLYIDYGYTGVIIGLALIGMMAKILQQRSRATGSMIFTAAHCFAVPALALAARETALGAVGRHIIWPLVLVLFLQVVFAVRRMRFDYRIPNRPMVNPPRNAQYGQRQLAE